tara:strand:+ start:145 stop:429 length:285 start_codon:yes stop_codon:yes gene_type:complete
MKKSDFDYSVQGMDNRGEYIRAPLKETKETVNHPEHYNQGIEVIDFIDSWNLDFTTGNIVKYVTRHKYKQNSLEDLKKAKWYLDRLIKNCEDKK